ALNAEIVLHHEGRCIRVVLQRLPNRWNRYSYPLKGNGIAARRSENAKRQRCLIRRRKNVSRVVVAYLDRIMKYARSRMDRSLSILKRIPCDPNSRVKTLP